MRYRCPTCGNEYGNYGEPAYVAIHCTACLRKGANALCEPVPETDEERAKLDAYRGRTA